MTDQPPVAEQSRPDSRIPNELLMLESQKREIWVLIAFAAAVLLLGALSLLVPSSFWRFNELSLRLPPQVLFIFMMALVVVALYVMRREVEIQKLRLANLQHVLMPSQPQGSTMMDAVTNVFSRGFLKDLLQGEVARAERNGRPLSLMMCDLNNFKQVNDRYGHLMGDYVLSQLAGILKACVRGSDYVIRYGGDEFLLVLPETDDKGGEVVRLRIHEKVADWDRTNRVGDLPVSVSLGLFLHVNGQSPEQDVAEADARMYAEKVASKRARMPVTNPAPAES
jgi:diguanylate cyclase (GGDEF)-like protein